MLFQVDLAGAKPVYQQLVDQVKFAIASGRLLPGDRLPPVRDVAVQVRVNRNTVARVYSELEREGVLYTRAGQGTFVSDRGSQLTRTVQRKQLQASLDELLSQAKLFGLSREQVLTIFSERMETIYPNGAAPARKHDSGKGGEA
ncbi:MAG: GntR family transcriptional regulator [Candidatus Sumerlaeaceae bacterium]